MIVARPRPEGWWEDVEWHRSTVRSLKRECLDRLNLFGERSLRNAVREYLANYHTERNHQGLGNGLIEPIATPEIIPPDGIEFIVSYGRPCGLLRSYSIAA